MTALLSDLDGHWLGVKDGDARARHLFLRHYSARARLAKHGPSGGPSPLFLPAGEKLVLLTPDGQALFGWLHNTVERFDRQVGVNCTVFRNEGPHLSSALIREADAIAWRRWPEVPRHFTYIDAAAIRSSNPGACFLKAQWRRVKGYRSKVHGYVLLEVRPEWVAACTA